MSHPRKKAFIELKIITLYYIDRMHSLGTKITITSKMPAG